MPLAPAAAAAAASSTAENEPRENVYNLTVEEVGAYYANGILVSNCDCLTYALLELMSSGSRAANLPAIGFQFDWGPGRMSGGMGGGMPIGTGIPGMGVGRGRGIPGLSRHRLK